MTSITAANGSVYQTSVKSTQRPIAMFSQDRLRQRVQYLYEKAISTSFIPSFRLKLQAGYWITARDILALLGGLDYHGAKAEEFYVEIVGIIDQMPNIPAKRELLLFLRNLRECSQFLVCGDLEGRVG